MVSRQKLREALARLPPLDGVPPPEPLPAVAEPLLPVGDGADAALAKELGRGGRLDAAGAQRRGGAGGGVGGALPGGAAGGGGRGGGARRCSSR